MRIANGSEPGRKNLSQIGVVLAAAGKSSRFGDRHVKKVFATINNKPVWMYAAEVFSDRQDVKQIVLVISPDDKEFFNEKYAGNAAMLGVDVVLGGSERAESVLNGLRKLRPEIDLVAVHDAARPCITKDWITDVFDEAGRTGAAILATPCAATLKKVGANQRIEETVSRDRMWLAQTPQVFDKQVLLDAYEKHPAPSEATDEASIVEAAGKDVHVVAGSPLNIKITTKSDLRFAELALKALPKPNPFPFA